jgi:hypothetical protein
VAAFFLVITRYHLLYEDWRGYLIAWFSLVFVANLYIGFFGKIKLEVKKERAEIQHIETNARLINGQAGTEAEMEKPAA